MKTKLNKAITLVMFILLVQAVGLIGSVFTFSSISNWYSTLDKPFFNPPNWIFGPVWTILYTLIGISLYYVYYSKSELRTKTLKIFSIHLILNAIWSIIFFGARNPEFAFAEIAIVWATLVYLMFLFIRFEKRAFYLFIPYLAWVSFASILNLAIVLLN